MLLCASSPISRKGCLWEAYRKHFAKNDDPVLVWHAPTRVMNPVVPQSDVDEALERDPAGNRTEYLAEWRTDIDGFVTREAVEACVDPGVRELPPQDGVRYTGFVDPSGGSSDSFTLAIAHREKGIGIHDVLREARAPFKPSVVVEEFAATLRDYGITIVYGDNYAKEWPIEQFAQHGIKYVRYDKFKSDIYLAAYLSTRQEMKCSEKSFGIGLGYDDPNGYEGNGAGRKRITDGDVRHGLDVMARDYPKHFGDMMADRGDADTADAFIQCVVFR